MGQASYNFSVSSPSNSSMPVDFRAPPLSITDQTPRQPASFPGRRLQHSLDRTVGAFSRSFPWGQKSLNERNLAPPPSENLSPSAPFVERGPNPTLGLPP